jgi:hypothetical protein
MEEKGMVPLNEEYLMSKIYIIRGVQVMLDFDLATIYGYTTKNFNRQVKNNIDRFDEDVVTEEKTKSAEVEEKLEEVSQEIIEDNL